MMRRGSFRKRFWGETLTAVAALLLSILTLVMPDWIEVLTGTTPDAGSGSLEWGVTASLLAIAAVSVVLAHHEWRTHALTSG